MRLGLEDPQPEGVNDRRYMMDTLRSMSMWTAESFETNGTTGTSVVVDVQLPPSYQALQGYRKGIYKTRHEPIKTDPPIIPLRDSTIPPTSVIVAKPLARSLADSKNCMSSSESASANTTDSRLEVSTTTPSNTQLLEARESNTGNTETPQRVLIPHTPERHSPQVLYRTSPHQASPQNVNHDVPKIQHRGSQQQPSAATELGGGKVRTARWEAERLGDAVSTSQVEANKPSKSSSIKKTAHLEPKEAAMKSGTTSRKAEVKARLRKFLDAQSSTETDIRLKEESPRELAREPKNNSLLRSVRVEPVSSAATQRGEDNCNRLEQKTQSSSEAASKGSVRVRYSVSQQKAIESIPEDASIESEDAVPSASHRHVRPQSFNPRHRSILETRSSFQTLPSVTEEVESKPREVPLVGAYQENDVDTGTKPLDADAQDVVGNDLVDIPVGGEGESLARPLEPISISETRKNAQPNVHVDTPIVPRFSKQQKLLPRLAKKIFNCKNKNFSPAARYTSFCSRLSPRWRMKDITVEDKLEPLEPELEPNAVATSGESENSIVVTIEEKSVVDTGSSSAEETLETVADFSNRSRRERPSPLSPIHEGLTQKGMDSLAVVPRSAKAASDAFKAFLWRNRASTEFCGLCTPENGFYTKEMVADPHEKRFWD